ncbi:alpha/beta fold hydrolase [Myceligenerans indicum]|uniref:Alpha/beta hydrolase n=1 Tax=Myceligenerans indicum TaxID=2593663 RepID=A0ABS1LFP2_9MICO|nr:alpha/beta hydrolase [Myceligenerans indicum]MBL0885061.1 alpha/beta hydrolase [Myceligenerans indicum]
MDTVEVNGLRLAYRRAGHGPAVMFVHGGAEDSRTWTPQLDALSDEFTVFAWDEPGAGGSEDVPDGFGLAGYADCLAGVLRTLGIAPAPVVGLSWGTTVILELYRRHPATVSAMVLADGYAGWRGSLGAQEAEARLSGVHAALDAPGQLDPTLPGLFAGAPPARFVPVLDAMAAGVRRRSMLTALTAMAAADLTEVLPTIAVPTQLVWGELDVRSPREVAREFERRIPGAHLELIPGCGHVSNLEAPESFSAIVRRFLQHRGRPSAAR